jgi:signal transduction histidine kinase
MDKMINQLRSNQTRIIHEWLVLNQSTRPCLSLMQQPAWMTQFLEAFFGVLNEGNNKAMQQMLEEMAQHAQTERLDLKTAARGILNLRSALLSFVIEGFENDMPMLSVRLNMIDTISNEISIRFLDLQRNPPQHHTTEKMPDTITRSWDSRPVNPPEDINQLLEEMAEAVLKMTGAESGFVFLAQDGQESFQAAFSVGIIDPEKEKIFHTLAPDPSTDLLMHRLLANGQPVSSSQAATDRNITPSIASALHLENLLAFPISSDPAHIYGMILACNPTNKPPFEQKKIVAGKMIARALGLAQENRLLYDETRKRLVESSGLRQITLALLQKLDLPEVLEIVCNEAQRLTNAMGSSVSLLENEKWLRIAFQTGTAVHKSSLVSTNESLLGLVVHRGDALLINNPQSEELKTFKDSSLSMLAVPLKMQGEVIGVLDVVNKKYGFTPEDVRVMKLFADQAAMAIEHARLYQSAEQVAILEERQRLARELHDSVNQALYGINLYASAAKRKLSANDLESVRKNLDILGNTAKDALAEMRLLVFELRPPVLKQKGLVSAIQERLKSVEERTELEIGLKSHITSHIPVHIEEALYRIVQESLNNITKHAQAQHVAIHLIQSGQTLRLRVQDDGIGFDVEAARQSGGMGLISMQERAESIKAEFSIHSTPGESSEIAVEVIL